MFSPRTDLALEAAALSVAKPGEKLSGVDTTEYTEGDINVTKVSITNEEGEKLIGKRIGNYITIECESLRSSSDVYDENIRNVFTRELADVIRSHKHDVIFVVGLGNRFVTPDSLGPKVSEGINVQTTSDGSGIRLCSVSTGVLGLTGIESGEIVQGISDKVKPDIIIAIDALASRSMHRICTTIQIADTGITPGAGVGNRRKALNEEVMGVPVIAIGVPTVVDASTVANDSVEHILGAMTEKVYLDNSFFDDSKRYALIKQILNPYFGELIVTPSQIDCVITKVAALIADGINDLENIFR